MKETEYGKNFGDYGRTEPIGAYGAAAPSATEWAPDPARTKPRQNGGSTTFSKGGPQNYSQTEAVRSGPYGFMPAVGWLVCIEGADRGRDFRLHDGYNRIGRNPGNDICISGDTTVSGDGHVLVAFDLKSGRFFAAPGNSINLVRLNDEVLMMAAPLKANDVLTVGTTRLLFVPLCSETFSW